ncbi:sulfur carrier protein ThiS [Gracilibacillus marinus]|jgi:sulfur carrier protein|uniref:Sulfur carrier protein ThiS n=1 Tax=Gracilibacillus marinus TaxID=630535 RepID=A0ABV8VWY1_9BACI
MQLIINGENVTINEDIQTIADVIDTLGLKNKIVIIELNGDIVLKEEHPNRKVKHGDRMELVHFVGGG